MADERFTEAVQSKNALDALVASEGWKILVEVLEEKKQILMRELLNPAVEMTDVNLREHRMAAANLNLIINLPHAIIEDASGTIEQFAKAAEEPEPEKPPLWGDEPEDEEE